MENIELNAHILARECPGVVTFRPDEIGAALGISANAMHYYFARDPKFSGAGDFHATSDLGDRRASNLFDAAAALGALVEQSPAIARAFWRAICRGNGLHFYAETSTTAMQPRRRQRPDNRRRI